MYVGALTLDVLFGDVRSLKQKRSEVRPLIAEVHRKFPGLAVAETGHLDLHRRTEIGVAVVTSTASHAVEMLEAACLDSSAGGEHSELRQMRVFRRDPAEIVPHAADHPLDRCRRQLG